MHNILMWLGTECCFLRFAFNLSALLAAAKCILISIDVQYADRGWLIGL